MSREAQTLSMKEPRGDPKLESVHSGSGPTAMGRCDAVRIRCLGRPECADIVEKLEFLRRSQFRGPPEASTEYSLGVRLSDRSCHVRRSNRRCCGNYRRRQHYMRSSEIFAAPQFPSFSTVSANSGRSLTWVTALESFAQELANMARGHRAQKGYGLLRARPSRQADRRCNAHRRR
jgi:hypothetical protein